MMDKLTFCTQGCGMSDRKNNPADGMNYPQKDADSVQWYQLPCDPEFERLRTAEYTLGK